MKFKSVVLTVTAAAALVAGCDSQRDKDVAAIRAQMEKEAAEKKEAQEKSKEKFKAMRSNAEKSAQSQGH